MAWFGTAMLRLERLAYRDSRLAGAAYTACGVAAGAAAGVLLDRLVGRRLACAVAATVCVAGRMLDDEADRIGAQLIDGDLERSRLAVRSLVGRRSESLTADEITRATIESVAENTVDAVTAPMLWAAIGGAPAVLAYRAINTMDAMVGHHNDRYERFGWASARLDDLANWVPARLTATLVLAPVPGAVTAGRSVVRQARSHPSPNGGLIEAAYAHRLGVRLGGVNRYGDRTEDRGVVGRGSPPRPGDISRATALRRSTSTTAALLLMIPSASAFANRCRRARRHARRQRR